MLLTWFILTGLILLFAPQGLTNNFQSTFAHIFRLPLSFGRGISLSASTQQSSADVVSRREYNKLQNHLANVTELLNQEQLKNQKLSGLRSKYAWEGVKYVVADVITSANDSGRNELIISCGEKDSIKQGQFVLGDNSIIGIITKVGPRTACVKLICDKNLKMAVKIDGTKINRVMQGNGDNSAKIQLMKHKVKIGKNVLASKKTEFLYASMVVGKVSKCKRNEENPLLWDVTVKPVCDIDRLSDVAVIIMGSQG